MVGSGGDSVTRTILAAAVAFGLFLLLAATFSTDPPAGSADRLATALTGHGVDAALVFTQAGRFPVFAVECVLLLIVGAVRRRFLAPLGATVAALVVAWKTSDLFKDLFHRPRPEHWVAIRETSFGYPSGHAVLSVTFYGLLAYVVWRSEAPLAVRRGVVALAAVWIVATGWSRLALGAHYLTDVAGGYCLGAVFFFLGTALVGRAMPAATNVGAGAPSEVLVRDGGPP